MPLHHRWKLDRKIWEPLQRFESRDYLARHYEKQHGRSLSAQRAHEIGSCFTQGREYFTSASTASDAVKPLLLYYGVASLGRGVTLLLDSRKREESLTPAHGLGAVEWAKTLHAGISNVLKLKVQCSKGTFPEFVNAVGNGQSYTWLDKDRRAGGFRNDFGEIRFLSDGSLISLGDLLSREKDLAGEYEIANDGWGNTDIGSVVALESCIRVFFIPAAGRDMGAAITSYGFPETAKASLQASPVYPQLRTLCVEIPASGEDRKKVIPMAVDQDKNIGWLIRPFSNGDNIIDIHRMFIESFMLGMLSRYFPSKWMSLLRSEKGDISRSVILAAIARIETEFPKLLRNHLPSHQS